MAIEQDHDGHQEAQGESVVGRRLVRFVEGVRVAEFVLVMHQLFLLCGREYGKFVSVVPVVVVGLRVGHVDLGRRHIGRPLLGKVVVVLKSGEMPFAPKTPGKMVVVCNEAHMVGVDDTPWDQTVAHHREQGDQNVVDHVLNVRLTIANINPTLDHALVYMQETAQAGHLPIRKRTQPRPKRVMSTAYSVTKKPSAGRKLAYAIPVMYGSHTLSDIFAKGLHASGEFRAFGMQHVSDVVVELCFVLFAPACK